MIKKIDIISIILIATGLILVAIYIYRSSLEIEMLIPFEKIGIGSMIVAVLLSIISGIQKEKKNKTCISSYSTPYYKTLSVPFILAIAFILIFFIFKLPENKGHNELKLFLSFIVISLFIVSYYLSKIILKLKWVEYDNNIITINGIFNTVTKPINDIKSVERTNFMFYGIVFNDNSTVYVYPKIFETFLSLGGEPGSIKKLRKLIELNSDKNIK